MEGKNEYAALQSHVADISAPAKNELSWSRTLGVWWSFCWRSAVYGFLGGAILGAVGGAIAGATGHLDKARLAGMIGGYIAGLALSILALKQALQKHLPHL